MQVHLGWSGRRASASAAGRYEPKRVTNRPRAPGMTSSEEIMNKDVDPQALSAAIAGFLACHVLTCRFLVQEGIVDRERFATYLETAMAEMAPGLEDPRTLFGVRQLINALRAPSPPGLQ